LEDETLVAESFADAAGDEAEEAAGEAGDPDPCGEVVLPAGTGGAVFFASG